MVISGTQQASQNAITLKGSADIVAEFFGFGVNSILYQRGIYPEDSFAATQKYGLTMWVCRDNQVSEYLNNIMQQIKVWLEEGVVKRLVLIITANDDDTGAQETLERWEFIVENEKSATDKSSAPTTSNKDLKAIQGEIKSVVRQITASVTFLPLIDCPCSFNLLIHTARDAEVPADWADSPPCLIEQSEQVKLRSFSTKIHRVDTVVTYKCEDPEGGDK